MGNIGISKNIIQEQKDHRTKKKSQDLLKCQDTEDGNIITGD